MYAFLKRGDNIHDGSGGMQYAYKISSVGIAIVGTYLLYSFSEDILKYQTQTLCACSLWYYYYLQRTYRKGRRRRK